MSDNQSAVQADQNNQNSNQDDVLLTQRLTAVNEVLSQLQSDDSDDDLVLGGPDSPDVAMAQTIQIGREGNPEPPVSQVAAAEPAIGEARPPAVPTSNTASGPANEDSIEQYMADLLARSNGYAAPSADDQPAVFMESPQEDVDAVDEELADPEQPNLADMAEKRQQSQSEVRNNLSSMRELANMNTRSAIETHCCKQLARRGILQIGMIAAGLFMSFFQLRTAVSVESTSFVGAMAGTIIAILGTFLFFRTTLQLQKSSHLRQSS